MIRLYYDEFFDEAEEVKRRTLGNTKKVKIAALNLKK